MSNMPDEDVSKRWVLTKGELALVLEHRAAEAFALTQKPCPTYNGTCTVNK